MVVKPNGPDMTLNYTLQLSSAGGPLQTYTAISVWQQVASGWILTVHTEQPQSRQATLERRRSLPTLKQSDGCTLRICSFAVTIRSQDDCAPAF